jgi:hypothetical protein
MNSEDRTEGSAIRKRFAQKNSSAKTSVGFFIGGGMVVSAVRERNGWDDF